MKALTLTQPWASAVALGIKTVETRSWTTAYRGPIAIHAAKGFPAWAREFAITEGFHVKALPLGAVVAIARLRLVASTELCTDLGELERHYGDYTPGRFAWFLEDVKALPEPIAARGALGLWEWEMPEVGR